MPSAAFLIRSSSSSSHRIIAPRSGKKRTSDKIGNPNASSSSMREPERSRRSASKRSSLFSLQRHAHRASAGPEQQDEVDEDEQTGNDDGRIVVHHAALQL